LSDVPTPGSMIKLGPGNEFDAIRSMAQRWGERAQGIGDDAALLDIPEGHRLVVSIDASIENHHFRRGWLESREIGWRAAASALSDLAAMGASAIGVLMAAGVPQSWRGELAAIADGVGDAADSVGAKVLGGDTSNATELSIAVTVLGAAQRAIGRGGAKPGDHVYVTGSLGGPMSALRVLQRGAQPDPTQRARFAHPEPRIREGQWLAAAGATAMIDISDGLVADAAHLAAASGARFMIDLERVPVMPGIDPRHAAQSGEEYELLLTSSTPLDVAAFAAQFPAGLTEIGRVDAGSGQVEARFGGRLISLDAGHDHFA